MCVGVSVYVYKSRAEPKLMRDEGVAFQYWGTSGVICRDLLKSFYYGKS